MTQQSQQKKKICWNCDGSVPREALNCPFCAVYLHREEDDDDEEMAPPFQLDREEKEESKQVQNKEIGKERFFLGWKGVASSLLFMMSGLLFLLFGFILAVFSKEGFLVLKWSAQYWWLYLALGAPLLIGGYLILRKTED